MIGLACGELVEFGGEFAEHAVAVAALPLGLLRGTPGPRPQEHDSIAEGKISTLTMGPHSFAVGHPFVDLVDQD
jgi:hypothetical protein